MKNTYLKNQTIYQVYVRNHTEAGTFRALIEDLPRIKALGASIIYLLPINPIGKVARKGELGSPYAISDYFGFNPELGDIEDFMSLLSSAHEFGLKVMLDIVLHHTSPDAILLGQHPEYYFYKNGKLGNKIGDWSDIIDLDYTNKDLWDYMLYMLTFWASLGVDGFRADVAPLIPLAFWEYIRKEMNETFPDLIWLSESVELSFLKYLKENKHIGHNDNELYSAFDMLYDYDVYPTLKAFLLGEEKLDNYIIGVNYQMSNYPKGYLKIRTLENHDTLRVRELCKNEEVLRNVTAWSFFQDGVGFIYGGQEVKANHRPNLFDTDKISFEVKDQKYYDFIKQLINIKKDPVNAA